MSHPDLRTPRLLLRAPSADDLVPLTAILVEPAVARFWPGYDQARVEQELLQEADDATVLTIVLMGEDAATPGQVIGAIQYSELADAEYRHAGVNLFLGTAWQGRGLGSEAIRAVLDHLFEVLGHHRMTIDPSAENSRAIRTYERLGFRPIGLMRQYERGPDGTFHDGMLLELLACDDRARKAAAQRRAMGHLEAQAPAAQTLSLRLATEADLPALIPMMVAFNRHEKISWDPELGEAPLRRLLTSPELGRVLLFHQAAPASPPLGYAVVTYGFDLEFGGRDAFLTELYLSPEVQGCGLGQQALQLILGDARAHGAGALHLQVRAENTAALNLYRAAGFIGTTRLFYSKNLSGNEAL